MSDKELRDKLITAWREGRDFAVRQVEQQMMEGYPRIEDATECAHGVRGLNDCIGCYDEVLLTKLYSIRSANPTDRLIAIIATEQDT